MKLLQILAEAATSKSKTAAENLISDKAQLEKLAKSAVAHLKDKFGDELMDTPMATITQHTRSHVDATTKLHLTKDDLEAVTSKVISLMKPFLNESDESEDDESMIDESKMSELDLDLTELSSTEFKKKYGCSKAEMRKKMSSDTVKESTLGIPGQEDSVETVMHMILAEELDADQVLTRPQGPMQRQAAKIIQRMYDSHTEGTGLHGDDDFEQIMLNVYEDIEREYGDDAGKSPFESVTEATRGRPRKNPPKEEKVPGKRGRPRKNPDADSSTKASAAKDDDGDDDKKVSSKALAKSMENDDGDEDDDAKKADSATKDAPKKIADTSVKPDQLKDANKKLPKQIQAAIDTYSVSSAFELGKKLRADFPDITSEELRQASVIWKSDNE